MNPRKNPTINKSTPISTGGYFPGYSELHTVQMYNKYKDQIQNIKSTNNSIMGNKVIADKIKSDIPCFSSNRGAKK